MSGPRPWEVLRSDILIDRWWITVRVDQVRMGNGAELEEFHVMEYPDWVCVVCRTDHRTILVVEQYRHAIGRIIHELPAGTVSPGQDPLEAAKQELLEEAGYEAEHWIYLGRIATEPSRHTNWAHCFFADGARRVSDPTPEASEDLALHEISPEELLQWIDAGKWVHGVQLSAILLAERRGLLHPEFTADMPYSRSD